MSEKKRSRIRRILPKTLLVLLVVVVVLAALNYRTLIHIYHGLYLFEPSRLTENFRSLDQRFPSRLISAGMDVSTFDYDLRELPDHYTYNGETRSISQFIEDTGTTGLVVSHGDRILYEEYFYGYKDTDRAIIWSVSKSVVSALVGIAIDEGNIEDIYDPVTFYVPSLSESGYNGVNLKDVMQMSSGIRFNEDYADPGSDINRMGALSIGLGDSLESFLLTLDSEREPGTFNKYISSDTQVLGMVLREATGMDLSRYTQEKLWQPAGMEADAYWLTDRAGVEAAFGGLNATLRDLARFGKLYLNEGFLNGQQIVPQEWVRASVTVDAPHLLPGDNPYSDWILGYGYQWWLLDGEYKDYLAMGIYGQAIYINPYYHIVIAKTSAYQEYNDDGEEMELESIEFFRAIARSI